MRIRLYYIDEPATGGATAPAGYALTTPQQRTDWNSFVDHLHEQRIAGSAALDKPGTGLSYLQQYQKNNPGFSVAPEQVSHIQHEQDLLRNGSSFGNMGPAQLGYLRQGLSPAYLARPVPAADGQLNSGTSQLYYPTSGEHGTDIEKYYGAKVGIAPTSEAAPSPAAGFGKVTGTSAVRAEGPGAKTAAPAADAIPLPDFTNAKSRGQYAANFRKKYGDVFQGFGDIPLNVNEVPAAAKDTSKNISEKYGKQYGIDPALLYTSYMIEGGSGLYKSRATGLDTRNRKPGDFGYQGFYGDKDFPVNGPESFGFVTFSDRFPDLVKAGYLSKNFEKEFRGKSNAGQFGENDFKSVESAMQAKAALLKYTQDEVDSYAKKKNIDLSPQAREFFTLAAYNGGEGALKKIAQYNQQGILQDDKFLQERPKSEEAVKNSTIDIWGHVAPRMKIRDALKKEKLFD